MSIFFEQPLNKIGTDTSDLLLAPASNVLLSANTSLIFANTNGAGIGFFGATSSYSIYMSQTSASGVVSPRLDSTSDFNMYFKMSSGTNRGFVFLSGVIATFQIEGNGNAQLLGALTIGAGSTANGLLTFSGSTTNRIDFGTAGTGAPTFTTRSSGTKITLYSQVNSTNVDYALGIEGNNMWFSIPQAGTTFGYKWYAGTTQVASLNAQGTLFLARQLIVTSTTDGQALITLNSERPWTINQRGAGSGAHLSFENTTDKSVMFGSGPSGNINIVLTPTDSNPSVRIGNTTLLGSTSVLELISSTPVGGSAPIADNHFTTRAYIDDLSFKNSVRVATTGFQGTALEASSNLNTNELKGPDPSVAVTGCTTSSGSASITVPGSGPLLPIMRIKVGATVSGTGIPGGTTVLTVSPTGNTVTLSANATASGSANVTLTFTNSIAALNVDTVALSLTNRVLVKDHPVGYLNGVYAVTNVGSTSVAWRMVRTTDADTWAGVVGTYFPVEAGSLNAESFWISTNDQGGTLNATVINYSCVGTKLLGLTVQPAFSLTMKGTTSNWIDFTQSGLGAPTFSTRSPGTKLILRNTLTSSLSDYGFGVDTSVLWSVIPQASVNYAFRWYAGTTSIMSLSGDATLTINSASQDNIILASTSSAGNTISWSTAGVATPTFNTRSAGTKLVLYPGVGATQVDFAIGISSGTVWQSVASAASNRYFAWYGGTTKVMELSGDGTLIINPAGGSAPMIRVNDTGSGVTGMFNIMAGFELVASEMNTTNLYTPAIKFGSTDSAFTTTNPKFLAYIAGEATETYNTDTAGGMGLAFFGSAGSPGAAPSSYTRMLRLIPTNATFSGSGTFGGTVQGSDPTATNHFMTLGYWEDKSAKDSVRLASTAWQNTFLEASSLNTTTSVLTGPSASVPISGCSTSNGSTTITVPGSSWAAPVYRIEIGATVSGTGIPGGTTVVSISGSSLVISANATNTSNAGVTLTFTNAIAALNIDGTTATVGQRVLIKNHFTASANGLYLVTAVGSTSVPWTLTRSSDGDTWVALPGAIVAVEEGAINSESVWECTSNQGGTLNSTSVTWQIISHKYATPSVNHNAVTGTIDYNLTLSAGSSNAISWSSAGVGEPSFSTRSPGTKLVIRSSLSSSLVDYAVGIASNTLWFSVPGTTNYFSFYVGESQIARLDGKGYLVIDNGADNFSAPPTVSTRSASTRIVLDQTLSSTDFDAAIGIDEVNGLWQSVPKGLASVNGYSWFWGGVTTGAVAYLSFSTTVAKFWLGSNFSGTAEIDLGPNSYISATTNQMTLSADSGSVTGLQMDRSASTVAIKVGGSNIGFYNAQGGRGGFTLLRRVTVMGGNVTTENYFTGAADTVVSGSNWVRQTDERLYLIVAVGGGGGGGGGARGDSSAARFGGGGGAGGQVTREWVHAFQFNATSINCSIGAGGTSGAAAASSGANGGNGGAGGATELQVTPGYLIRANGGAAGSGGTTSAGTAGAQNTFASGAQAPNIAGGAGAGGTGAASNGLGLGAGGGGGGGGLAITTQTASAGGNGTQGNPARAGASMGTAGAGGAAGANGGTPAVVDPAFYGRGGGGGGSATSNTAGAGGAGTAPGGGGGGGGAAASGFGAQGGGTGGGGGVIIYCYG